MTCRVSVVKAHMILYFILCWLLGFQLDTRVYNASLDLSFIQDTVDVGYYNSY